MAQLKLNESKLIKDLIYESFTKRLEIKYEWMKRFNDVVKKNKNERVLISHFRFIIQSYTDNDLTTSLVVIHASERIIYIQKIKF